MNVDVLKYAPAYDLILCFKDSKPLFALPKYLENIFCYGASVFVNAHIWMNESMFY